METKIEEARAEFNAILDFIIKAALGLQIHEVEEEIYRRLLRLGRILLELFVLAAGTGKSGDALIREDGAVFRFLRESGRSYLSIFGEITIVRAYYARAGEKGLFPLDARLNLPHRKYSYALQNRMTDRAVKESYECTAASLKKDFHLELAHRPIQEVTRDCTAAVDEFMDSLPPPPAELEGPILVHTVDCKGIRMRPDYRNANRVKTEDKPGEKRMACVAGTYSIYPHFRPNEAIADSFFRPADPKQAKEKDPRRPKPLFGRTFASLKESKSQVFGRSTQSAKSRIHAGTQEKLSLMDGETALKNRSREFLPHWPEALDITHAVTRLRIAGGLHYSDGHAADEYGREGLLLLLEGEVDDVIEDWEIALEEGALSSKNTRELKKALGYFRNNRDRMDYHRHLTKGLPIASGVIESTCNSLINIRMEGPGMFWSEDGAEAMLKLRGVYLDDLWEKFWEFRTNREKKRLYSRYDTVCALENQEALHGKAA
jgi:hypothetical protein